MHKHELVAEHHTSCPNMVTAATTISNASVTEKDGNRGITVSSEKQWRCRTATTVAVLSVVGVTSGHRSFVLELNKAKAVGDGDTRLAAEVVHCEGGSWERGVIRVVRLSVLGLGLPGLYTRLP